MTQSVELAEGGKNVQFTDRTVPWMKLGEVTSNPLTAGEAAKAGGLDFTVSQHEVFFSCDPVTVTDIDGNTTTKYTNVSPDCLREMTNRRIIVRDDTLEPLAIVSSGYPVVQYHEAFDFMDSIVKEHVGTRYVAAGSLKGGKQGFMVVRAPQKFQLSVLDGEDPHEMFMVLRTSHDLTRAIEVMMMPLRGRCMNQMSLTSFAKTVPHRWAVTHSGNVQQKLANAHDSIQKAGAYAQRYNELAKRLVSVKLTDDSARGIVKQILRDTAKRDETVDLIMNKMHTSEMVGWSNTGWGLVNAVSDHFDWGRKGGSPASRFLNALEGQTHKAINKTALLCLRVGQTA